MSMDSYEWCNKVEEQAIWHIFGVKVACRWDEDWVTYTIFREEGYIPIRAHGDDVLQVRAQVMKVVLGL